MKICLHAVGVSTHTERAWKIACLVKLGDTDQNTYLFNINVRDQLVKSLRSNHEVEEDHRGGTNARAHWISDGDNGAACHNRGPKMSLWCAPRACMLIPLLSPSLSWSIIVVPGTCVIWVIIELRYYIMSYDYLHVEALALRDSVRVLPVQHYIVLVYGVIMCGPCERTTPRRLGM